jgi:hypothetical protein
LDSSIFLDFDSDFVNFHDLLLLNDQSLFNDPVIPPDSDNIQILVECDIDFKFLLNNPFFLFNNVYMNGIISINLEFSDGDVDLVLNLDFVGGDLFSGPMFPVEELVTEVCVPVISGGLDFKGEGNFEFFQY